MGYRNRISNLLLVMAMCVICINVLVADVFGLSLIDGIENITSKIGVAPDLPFACDCSSDFTTQYTIDETGDVTIARWMGIKLEGDKKYLLSRDFMHTFTLDDDYISSFVFEVSDVGVSVQSKYISELEKEGQKYKEAGFEGIPKYHVTTLTNTTSYKNQMENDILPNTTCAPTAVAIKMQLDGYIFDSKDTLKYNDYLQLFEEYVAKKNGIPNYTCISTMMDLGVLKRYFVSIELPSSTGVLKTFVGR